MNVYHVGKCPHCKKAFVIPYENGETDTCDIIVVHGATDLAKAIEMIEKGYPMYLVAKMFCGNCGNLMSSCECLHPTPQHSNMK